MPTYIIERAEGEYHVITGSALVYNLTDTGSDDTKEKKVKEVKARFKKIKDSPNTHYVAVEVTSGPAIMGGNTGFKP